MAHATETYRKAPPHAGGVAFETYLGAAALAAGAAGLVAIFGSVDALWSFARQALGVVYLFTVAVVG